MATKQHGESKNRLIAQDVWYAEHSADEAMPNTFVDDISRLSPGFELLKCYECRRWVRAKDHKADGCINCL